MRTPLAALAGLVVGFLAGELLAAAIGITIHVVADAEVPLAVRLTPFYLAAGGLFVGPLIARRAKRR
ncbi:DUF5957 family protein [Streptomyces sp. NPDC127098]|uniref:DUF5957 family protein n=1 Tax=Streptomyces sp. NPDC127098 TaxID=3347137 RepID=UPI00365FF7E0